MRVVVPLDHRFLQPQDGSVWTDGAFDRAFWRRYLGVFEGVRIVARARAVAAVEPAWKRVDGGPIAFHPVPYYVGPGQYALRAREVMTAAGKAVEDGDAVILRGPGQVANCVAHHLLRRRRPYGVEVLADPAAVFRRGSVPHSLRALFRWWFTGQLRRQCRHASAVAYVAGYLRRLYPAAGYTATLSDVVLTPADFAPPRCGGRGTTLIAVASLAQTYKGIDVLLYALQACPDVRLRVVGDGRYRPALEDRAATLGLASRVSFVGQLVSGEAVHRELDGADIFVLPSRAEGLPRAMIEAMARGLPAIGSAVGGIPELLAAEDQVPPGDAAALAAKIREVARDPDRRAAMSARNAEKARQYCESVLQPRRTAFYESIRRATEEVSCACSTL